MVKISIDNLSVRFNQKMVLDHVSCHFNAGRFTAIMGQNGSGKTTMIRCINKDLKLTTGEIKIGNQSLAHMTTEELAMQIAFVPQGQEPVFGSSVYETVLTGRLPFITWAPSQKDFDKVDEIIDQLHLNQFAFKNINALSGGERQKVYIARALVQDTPVIILDEPITYLDLKHQLEIMKILKDLARSGLNIIMVVHDINLALRFCDDFIFIKSGHLISNTYDDINETLIQEIFDVKMSKFIVEDVPFFILKY